VERLHASPATERPDGLAQVEDEAAHAPGDAVEGVAHPAAGGLELGEVGEPLVALEDAGDRDGGLHGEDPATAWRDRVFARQVAFAAGWGSATPRSSPLDDLGDPSEETPPDPILRVALEPDPDFEPPSTVELVQIRTMNGSRQRTLSEKRITKDEIRIGRLLYPEQVSPPRVRSECVNGIRPCPFVSCKYHLAFDIKPCGSLLDIWPAVEVWELKHTCALDEAKQEHTLEQIADLLNLTRERVRQIERRALAKLGVVVGPEDVDLPDHDQGAEVDTPRRVYSRTAAK
jgi:hypothetical protein